MSSRSIASTAKGKASAEARQTLNHATVRAKRVKTEISKAQKKGSRVAQRSLPT